MTDCVRFGSFLCSVRCPVTNELLHSLSSNLKRRSAHSKHTKHPPSTYHFYQSFHSSLFHTDFFIISRIKLEFAFGLVFLTGRSVTAKSCWALGARCEGCGTAVEAEKWIPAPLFSISQNFQLHISLLWNMTSAQNLEFSIKLTEHTVSLVWTFSNHHMLQSKPVAEENQIWCLCCLTEWWKCCMEARVKALIPLKQGINVSLRHPQREKATQTQQQSTKPQPSSLKESVLLSGREITLYTQARNICAGASWWYVSVERIRCFWSVPADRSMFAVAVSSRLISSWTDVKLFQNGSVWASERLL